MAIKSYEERLKEVEQLNQGKLDEKIAANNSIYDTQKTQTTTTYNKQIDDTSDSYEDLYRENAVQKIINEREVAENMANLGLTDSGLNRTQQTAVQLSYANNKNKFDISRQKAIDSLASQLADKISQIDIAKTQSEQSIRDTWNQENAAYATELYNADVEAETARYKAQQEQIAASNKAYYSALANQESPNLYTFAGEDPNNSGYMIFYDSNGKKHPVEKGFNPYTGDNNKKVYKGLAFFSNGYQPKQIYNDAGDKLTLSKVMGENNQPARIKVNGKEQNVWTAGGSYYYWDGYANTYKEFTDAEKISLGIV